MGIDEKKLEELLDELSDWRIAPNGTNNETDLFLLKIEPIVKKLGECCKVAFKDFIKSYNTISVAMLLDDVFDVIFYDRDNLPKGLRAQAVYLRLGVIGLSVEKMKDDIHSHETMTYRLYHGSTDYSDFGEISDDSTAMKSLEAFQTKMRKSKLKDFYLAPIVVQKEPIASIQVSFNKKLNKKNANLVREFLSQCRNILAWRLKAEQNRLMGAIKSTEVMVNALESKNPWQSDHSKNVYSLVRAIIYRLNTLEHLGRLFGEKPSDEETILAKLITDLPGYTIARVHLAALLHDIGKVSMSDESLDLGQFRDLADKSRRELHAYFSYAVLDAHPSTRDLAKFAGYHHERYNGSGYPFGAVLGPISVTEANNTTEQKDFAPKDCLLIQIIAFADAYDSYARERPGKERKRYTHDKVMEELGLTLDGKKIHPLIFKAIKRALEPDENQGGQAFDDESHGGIFLADSRLNDVIVINSKKNPAPEVNKTFLTLENSADKQYLKKLAQMLKKLKKFGWIAIIRILSRAPLPSDRPFGCVFNMKIGEAVDVTIKGEIYKWWMDKELEWSVYTFDKTDSSYTFIVSTKSRHDSETLYPFCSSLHNSIKELPAYMAVQFLQRSDNPPSLSEVLNKLNNELTRVDNIIPDVAKTTDIIEIMRLKANRWRLLPPWDYKHI